MDAGFVYSDPNSFGAEPFLAWLSDSWEKKMFNAMVLALMFGLQLVGSDAAKVQAPTLELVLVKDHLPGSFLTSETVYADREFIFLASDEGTLFVLENSEPDFPLVAEIAVSVQPLRSVRADRTALYMTSEGGKLYMYENKKPFRFYVRAIYFTDRPTIPCR